MSKHYQIWAVLLFLLVLGGCQKQSIEMPLLEVVGYSVQSRPIEQWTLGRGEDYVLHEPLVWMLTMRKAPPSFN